MARDAQILAAHSRILHLRVLGFNATHQVYVEVISYQKAISDARKRNAILFHKLGLPPEMKKASAPVEQCSSSPDARRSAPMESGAICGGRGHATRPMSGLPRLPKMSCTDKEAREVGFARHWEA